MENNYSVYQHVTPDGLYYFGQTQNVEKRWCNNGAGYKETALQPYIEKYGWDNIQHKVLYENISYDDALKIEDSLIISGWKKGNCINKQRSGNVSNDDDYIREYQQNYQKHYCQKNKGKKQDYDKQYYEQNKDNINERHKQYQEKIKHDIKKYQKQYYEKNREKIREYQRQYYQRKRQDK